jgi:hypothetical protein
MTQADRVHSMPPTNTPIDTSRRSFLGGTAAALAAGTAVNVVALATRPAAAGSPDDSALLKLEEQHFEQHELAHAYDDEMNRLAWIWTDKYRELYEASVLGHNTLSPQERADIVAAMAECIEHTRLGKLQDPHYARMDALVREMWAIPALTAEGRRAKVLVALDILPSDWRVAEKDCDYGIRETRQLLFELVGGEPGAELRDQFRGDECA